MYVRKNEQFNNNYLMTAIVGGYAVCKAQPEVECP